MTALDAGGADRLKGLSEDERFAAVAVERATGGRAEAHDVGGRQGAYDFTLIYPNGRVAAAEVTSYAQPGRLQLESLLGRTNYEWPNPGAWIWTIYLSSPTDLPELRHNYAHVIARCETYGVTRPEHLPWELQEADPTLRWLEEREVSMWGYPVPGADTQKRRPVYVMPDGDGGIVDEELSGLEPAVADMLREPTVARRVAKVSNADVHEHHLFVRVDMTGFPFSVTAALTGHPVRLPPNSKLTLPGKLTHLWLALQFAGTLLGWTSERGWQSHDVYGPPRAT
jgi:hypothetical protein